MRDCAQAGVRPMASGSQGVRRTLGSANQSGVIWRERSGGPTVPLGGPAHADHDIR
jgi:hypothetical protein